MAAIRIIQERNDGGLDQSASRISEESGWILDVLKAEPIRFTGSLDMKF